MIRTIQFLSVPAALLVFSSACSYEASPNPQFKPNVISGTVVVEGVPAGETGPTYITIYAASNPGPPLGTGSPVTFAAVHPDAFTGAGAGVQSASFSVTGLADGEYYVNGFMDLDGDFNPFSFPLSGATCGDVTGTHIAEVATKAPATVTVTGGELKNDVTVDLFAKMPFERPAFSIDSDAVLSKAVGATFDSSTATGIQLYTISATGIDVNYQPLTENGKTDYPLMLEGPCVGGGPVPGSCDVQSAEFQLCDTAFELFMVDADGDGVVDFHPDHDPETVGALDIWPRVYLRYLGIPQEDGTFVNDLPEGEYIAGENFPLAFEFNFFGTAGYGPPNTYIPMQELSMLWAPAVRHYKPDGAETAPNGEKFDYLDLRLGQDIPAGAYSITVISRTGQTWATPNDIAFFGLDPENNFNQGTYVLVEE